MEERDEVLKAAEEAETEIEAVEAEEYEDSEAPEREMSVVDWLWRLCVPMIPCAGIVIYIVLLCMWAFGKKQTPAMRVWAKAALIATLIKIAFVGIIFLVIQLNVDVIGFVGTFLKKIF
ncbi:MAG: hypothetical protein IKZ81_01770 [Clostridia bacterium]|nr:hypothetical protein [Clostridia bacterium]MBR5768644.1 hypothetical protein [Clostridia bacterium]MBR5942049.1 hypothetical protein [Clostridia bacterium]